MSDDTINYLLKQAGRAPLLNKAQEVDLSRQIQAWLTADNPDTRTIKRGQRAKRKLLECNMRLVIHCAKRYQARIKGNPSLSFEDLIQEGALGLNRAAEKFNPERGYAFSTYSFNWIRQSIGRMVDINGSSIRVASHVVHTALAWKYRPEEMTVEEFAESRNLTVKKVKTVLALHARAQVRSYDCKTQADKEDSDSLLDFIAADCPLEDEQDYAQILDDLKYLDGGVLKESLATLEIAEEAKPAEMAKLMGWGRQVVHRRLKDCRSQVREHLPSHIRDAIVGPERNLSGIMKPPPIATPKPVKELVAVGCSAIQVSPMTASIQPTQNGHSKSLEAEAMEVIEAVKSEPAEPGAEASKPKRRARRTAAEIQAEKQSALISVVVDGTQIAGQPDHIARLLNAMKAA